MKNLILVFALILSTLSFSQTEEATSDNKGLNPYLAVGVSIGEGNFSDYSYPSVEVGVPLLDKVSVGVVLGRNNFTGALGSDDTIGNYWYEGKVQVTQPVGPIAVYGLFGVGNSFSGGHDFIEYGGGVSKEWGKISVFVQYTNWYKVNYVTPGVSFSL